MTRNVTDAAGVRFVGCPPRIMQSEPQRENYRDMEKDAEDDEEENEGEQPQGSGSKKSVEATIKSIQGLLSKRQDKSERLPEKAVTHWNALKAAFSAGARAGALPDMPVTYSGVTFSGCPRQFLPILKEMRRFPRPFIYWDPFKDEPPSSWPDAAAARAAQEARGVQPEGLGEPDRQGGSEGGLRDAREHCHVTGFHYTKVQRAMALRQLTEEDWVEGFAGVAGKNRKEPIEEGLLYLMQLSVPEGGFKLGFAQAGKARIFALEEGAQHQAKWFVKTGERTTWSETPTFIPYMVGQKRSVEYVPSESFLMVVDDQWLTEGTVAAKHTEGFRITKDFMRRLRLLKEEYPVEFGEVHDRRHQQTGAQQAAPRAPHRATDPEGETMRAEGRGKRPADDEAADSTAAAKRPATTPLPSPAPKATDLAVIELQRYVQVHLPAALVTKELGSAVSDKELKGDVQLLVDQGLQECGVMIGPTNMRLKLSGLKTKTWLVVRGPTSAAQGQSSVLGFIAYGKATYAGSPAGYIHELHVHASLRGKGVGTALMVAAEDDLRTMGLSLCYLTVHTNNMRAQSDVARNHTRT